jgi:DNA-directed RNA polymerase subunit E'/Rpb7
MSPLLPYSTKININFDVSINFDKLDNKINEYLNEYIKTTFENTCTKDIGYILKVENVKALSNIVSQFSPKVIFKVSFDAYTFKPIQNNVLTLKINLIFDHGILILIDSIKILIPILQLKEKYELIKEEKMFKNKTNKKTIKAGDDIQISIIHFEYHNKGYNCIAKLAD